MYINLLNAQCIPNEAVVKETSDGLLYFDGGSWKYLAHKEYKRLEEGEEYSTKKVGKNTYVNISENELVPAEKTTTKTARYYTSFFGLNDLVIGDRKFYRTSGLLTNDIYVEKGKPIRLKADVREQEFASVEFSIIDGNEEVPILLAGEEKIVDEKLFFGCDTRMSGTDKVYKKDFKPITHEPDDNDYFNDFVLTVSYKPDEKYQLYTPKHDKVKVKVVIRLYKENALSPEISNIMLAQEV